MHTGSCLCGKVTFEIDGNLPAPNACHCGQCRKQSGHYWASTEVKRSAMTITGQENLSWFSASATVRRGFCGTCGSFLFWDPLTGTDWTAIAMGAIDAPSGTNLEKHIFTADKGDYYDIADGLSQEAIAPC